MPYLIEQCVDLFHPDCVLVFVDVTSRLSNKKGMQWRHRMETLNIPVHLVYNKSDIQNYNNKLDEMVQNLPCSTYSIISGRMGVNVHAPLLYCLNV